MKLWDSGGSGRSPSGTAGQLVQPPARHLCAGGQDEAQRGEEPAHFSFLISKVQTGDSGTCSRPAPVPPNLPWENM